MSFLRRCTLKPLSSSLFRKPSRKAFFHASPSLAVLKPFILADIGEGIKEVQIIQWFVEPEARVEQFDKICEVQSDKAAVDITSRFDGVIKKLHYEADDMVQVGKPLCDIDVLSEISPEDEALVTPPAEQAGSPDDAQQPQKAAAKHTEKGEVEEPDEEHEVESKPDQETPIHQRSEPSGLSTKHGGLATPAVRGLLKRYDVDIAKIPGTGRDGRVLKPDVHKYVASLSTSQDSSGSTPPTSTPTEQTEEPIKLTTIQSQMFKTMTRSLSIPHFLYADEIDITALSTLRRRLNAASSPPHQKLSYLPFIIKALSLALLDFPLLNARIDTSTPDNVPRLLMRKHHNIGIAMDTPQGLLVPNIKHVQSHSILSLASEIARLHSLARKGGLSARDMTGGTITVSNIGSIGGTYVSPIIASGNEVAILGIGKVRTVPAFGDGGKVVRKEVCNFSWSADHRVVDGATVARVGERVRALVEEPGGMIVGMR
ncbi:2-oxoacid dehydrogenase acyltransferase [Physcia stellaris]|nr:2-oxoacid dehydrogenase acyltransferase [Physcia stellaris]